MRRRLALPLLLLASVVGCDAEKEGTLPVVQIVGADLRHTEPLSGPTLDVWPETREVDRIPAPPCDDPRADCLPGEAANGIVPERTQLVADRAVRISETEVEAGTNLLPLLDDLAYLRRAVYPFAVVGLPIQQVGFDAGRTRLTASWETDDGLAFSSSATVSR